MNEENLTLKDRHGHKFKTQRNTETKPVVFGSFETEPEFLGVLKNKNKINSKESLNYQTTLSLVPSRL